jgi:hypothetical protein
MWLVNKGTGQQHTSRCKRPLGANSSIIVLHAHHCTPHNKYKEVHQHKLVIHVCIALHMTNVHMPALACIELSIVLLVDSTETPPPHSTKTPPPHQQHCCRSNQAGVPQRSSTCSIVLLAHEQDSSKHHCCSELEVALRCR